MFFSVNISFKSFISSLSYGPRYNITLVYYWLVYTCPSKSHQSPPDQLKHITQSSMKSIFLPSHKWPHMPSASGITLSPSSCRSSAQSSSITLFSTVSSSLLPQTLLFCCLRHLRQGESSPTYTRPTSSHPIPSQPVLSDPKHMLFLFPVQTLALRVRAAWRSWPECRPCLHV